MRRLPAVQGVWASILAIGVLAGCQGVSNVVTAPTLEAREEESPARGGARRAEMSPVVPRVQHLIARSDGSALTVVAQYDGIRSGRLPAFSPDVPGGWCFQLFLDVDGDATGFGSSGLDYVLRSMEIDAQGRAALRRTEGGDGPGGWGEAVGMVSVGPSSRQLTITVPLEHLGPDDGAMEFVLEFYETVPGGEGPPTVSHVYVCNYAGDSTTGDGPRPLAARPAGAVAPRASKTSAPVAAIHRR